MPLIDKPLAELRRYFRNPGPLHQRELEAFTKLPSANIGYWRLFKSRDEAPPSRPGFAIA